MYSKAGKEKVNILRRSQEQDQISLLMILEQLFDGRPTDSMSVDEVDSRPKK